MPSITPFLWFEHQAEEAAQFYVSLFRNSRILASSPISVKFQLDGQEVIALNGRPPKVKLTEAVSLAVECATQQEVDEYWGKLTAGGEEGPCGWLKDKYGVSWQVVPTVLDELLYAPEPRKAKAVLDAVLQMKKLDIAALQRAYEEA